MYKSAANVKNPEESAPATKKGNLPRVDEIVWLVLDSKEDVMARAVKVRKAVPEVSCELREKILVLLYQMMFIAQKQLTAKEYQVCNQIIMLGIFALNQHKVTPADK